jgi:3-methyladenine DNA glycosylase AlkD
MPRKTAAALDTLDAVLAQLRAQANLANVAGMARFGINPNDTLGVSIPALRKIAKAIGVNHALAGELWASGIHEARILASLVDDPRQVSTRQMERWVRDFDSWDVCDQVCSNLFSYTTLAHAKAAEWSARDEEFVRRAAFALMAALAVHDKQADDEAFLACLPLIARAATDERNFVRKAVNWALRQIGKRNTRLNQAAIETAQQIQALDSKAARWVAADALRELTSEAVRRKLEQ